MLELDIQTSALECFGRMTGSSNCKWMHLLWLLHWCVLLFKASTMAITFVGKTGVVHGNIGARLYYKALYL